MTIPEIGWTVRALREHAGLTRADLCALAGVGRTALFALEHGKPTLRLDVLTRVLAVLNLRLELAGPPLETLPSPVQMSHAAQPLAPGTEASHA